ncbi:F-type H+-transporting ATPase subunit J [Candida albicans P57072]|uniref:F1F0 ATP synthase subunit i n=3 Tax=Candida TaxID=5475 RepID=A0A1D8PG50_CANAL|nr:ATP synthase J chain, mitochondrial, putative [Candida dubliniensis CD36]XP_019330740.1 F1F0 ATP synthase subunit i [Candida albicans SC5314]KGQ89892.1 F-type H+-transporting ATPase subunit J [Candida albicans P94015]KGQ96744.1 F-type H+-transporting ATPase subunit J [Candida albicans P37005]KGR01297.1 F-type H+-transporting ATPase subunit J [Candida albicans GC75]KGR13145.1 F-type H+-transporting ATPase subunit J [Candida albicans P57072]KGR15929.1 F-type H+-transporting ATPase subunit J |eukprot:XP_019330740.1 F1F0 ATP synthase subunit i [Candida albicans SC5314]
MGSLPRYPFPVLKTYWPYAIGAGITYYLVYKGSIASANSDEFINDPRNPRFAKGGKYIDLDKRD